MTDGANPYQAPETRRGQFSVQWKRPMIYTVAGSLCWFFAVMPILAFCFMMPQLIRLGAKNGWAIFWSTKIGRELMIGVTGAVIVIPLLAFAGQAFLKGRGRRGLILGLLAYGISYLIHLVAGI